MRLWGFQRIKIGGLVTLALVAVALVILTLPLLGLPSLPDLLGDLFPGQAVTEEPEPSATLVPGRPDTIQLPTSVVKTFGVETFVVRPVAKLYPLPPLSGSLALDTNTLARVHSRFPGEVIEIGPSAGKNRRLRFGDRVKAGQLLAVVWSKDLGEKKSELVDGLARLDLDREKLQRVQQLYRKGACPENTLREMERTVQIGEIAVARAKRTLQSWRLMPAEIQAVEMEADRLRKNPADANDKKFAAWARVDIRAPFSGTILEKNVVQGDIVDTATDLFKIGDLSRLSVWVNLYEDQLPALAKLPRPVRFTIHLRGHPQAQAIASAVDVVGDIVDPMQHTTLLLGQIANLDGSLRAGQGITATIDVPPASQAEVEIPLTGLLEDGRDSLVVVQEPANEPWYSIRRIVVVRRQGNRVVIRSQVTGRDARQGLQPLRAGERVVIAGAVGLKAAWDELKNKK